MRDRPMSCERFIILQDCCRDTLSRWDWISSINTRRFLIGSPRTYRRAWPHGCSIAPLRKVMRGLWLRFVGFLHTPQETFSIAPTANRCDMLGHHIGTVVGNT